MKLFKRKSTGSPDREALARLGASVRERLQADPNVHKLPTEDAEIYALGAFFDAAECWQLTTMIDTVAQPSTLFASSEAEADYRTSYSGNLDHHHPFIQMISRRIDDLLGLPSEFGETLQGQRYHPGQQYKEHHDWFAMETDYWKTERKRGGQRCWTAMAFLNDVEEGGHTYFTRVGLSVTPQKGALLVWNNANPDGTPNEMTMHAANPVIKGVKHVVTKWYRVREWG
ncbi:2OG-Fe(II) oxygenase [Croceicoccus estronivorus]|uniref:prolyl hydroxylase family protein n=1 Tax=Croceicoccus estronivorus TaxID=1172626 RepID=UPI00082C58AD|nr:2OG-Fe(II) oxygenase [Croceicoccus estronivorus]OCC22834.1 2OG-Fe(II) oxygenase [Croceicoccus estronivorus]